MKRYTFIASLFFSLMLVASYSFGQVVFLDTFSNSFPNPEIGTYMQTGGTNEIFNNGSNNWLRSVDKSSTDVNAGFVVTGYPTSMPVKGTVEYDFQIVPVGGEFPDSYIYLNAFQQELILSPLGNNLFLYWGENNQLHLRKSFNDGTFSDPELINIPWASNTVYHINWTIDADTNRFGLTINGTTFFDNVPFGRDIDNIQAFSFASNMQSTGAQLMDNIKIISTTSHWTSVSPPSVNSTNWDLFGVHFPSATEGWAVGIDNVNDKGVLLHYLNGQWVSVDLPHPPLSGDWGLTGVHFTSENKGWVVGQQAGVLQGLLLHYSNGIWKYAINPNVSNFWTPFRVHFTSENEGWVVGTNNTNNGGGGLLLHYTTYPGTVAPSWGTVPPPDLGNVAWGLLGVHFTSKNEGWAVGRIMYEDNNPGVLLHYLNGNWVSVTPPDVSNHWELWGVNFPSPYHGWAVGTDIANGRGVLLRYTRDQFSPSQEKWESILPPANVSKLYGVNFTSEDEGWAVGVDNVNGRGVLLHYLNGVWTSVEPPSVSTNWDLWDVHFSSPNQGWAVGSDGVQGRGVLLRYGIFLPQLKKILNFFDASEQKGTLVGSGPGKSADGRLKALRNMIVSAGSLIEKGDYPNACEQLMDAYNRTDGKPKPPEFADGTAARQLAIKIMDLMNDMECREM